MEDDSPLRNIANDIGEDRKGVTKTAINHFNKFLERMRKENDGFELASFNAIDATNIEIVTPDLLSKFGDYLHRYIKKLGTAVEYLGATKCELIRRFPLLETTQLAGQWYKQLRTKLDRLYSADCKANGTRKKDSAPAMTEKDLELLNSALLARNDRESDRNRCLFTWQWQSLGRISEVCALRLSKLKNTSNRHMKNVISLMISRTKTSVETDLLVFLHADVWEICPFHALATAIVTTSPTDQMFPQIPEAHESEYVNRVLAQLLAEISAENREDVEKLTAKLLSHSTRSGSASHANAHPDIQTSWIVLRGGWTLDGLQTVFNYLCGTDKTDSRVGRALSGWPSAVRGGNCPSEECLPAADKKIFKRYSDVLLSAAPSSIRYALMCTLLLHFPDMCRKYPSHNLIVRMLETGRTMRVVRATLDRWSIVVKQAFHRMNAPFISVSELDDEDSVPYSTIAEFMEKSVQTLNLVLQAAEANEVHRRCLEDRLARIESILERIAEGQGGGAETSATVSVPAIVSPIQDSLVFTSPDAVNFSNSYTDDSEEVAALEMDDAPCAMEWPSDWMGLGDLTVGGLFVRWYITELHKCDYATLEPASLRKHYNMCKKTIQFCKLFLPGGTVIQQRPPDSESAERWQADLTKWGTEIDSRMKSFLNEHRPIGGKRRRTWTVNVTPTYKKITALAAEQVKCGKLLQDLIHPTQHPIVVDNAWK